MVMDHLRVAFVVHVPCGQAVHEVVLQQLGQGDTPDVLDVIVGHGVVASKVMGLFFQAQLVPGTRVGRQIGDQLGAFPVAQHDVEAFQQTVLIENVGHE
ncbi:hypothetical protein D3C81_1579260 [compost metagenome]